MAKHATTEEVPHVDACADFSTLTGDWLGLDELGEKLTTFIDTLQEGMPLIAEAVDGGVDINLPHKEFAEALTVIWAMASHLYTEHLPDEDIANLSEREVHALIAGYASGALFAVSHLRSVFAKANIGKVLVELLKKSVEHGGASLDPEDAHDAAVRIIKITVEEDDG